MNQEENKQELQNNINEIPQPQVVSVPQENIQPSVQPVVEQQIVNNQPIQEPVVEKTVVQQPTQVVQQPAVNETPVEIKEEVEPVQEVKVEEKKVEEFKPKKGKTILLIIFFIFLFSFVMGMPYVNEFIDNLRKDAGLSEIERRAKQIEEEQNKEREKRQPSKKEEQSEQESSSQKNEIPKILTCTITVPANDTANYDKTTVQRFEYNEKNQVITSEIENTYTFQEQNESYMAQKSNCDDNSLKYIDKEGYSFSCSYTDLSVVIGNKFELDTFKPIIDGDTTIIANATYKEDLDALKTRLTNSGYTCE